IGGVLTALAESHRLCIVLIEHDLDFVREISTRLVVLHMGKILADGPLSDVADSELIRTIYVGGAARSCPRPPPSVGRRSGPPSPSQGWRVDMASRPCSAA